MASSDSSDQHEETEIVSVFNPHRMLPGDVVLERGDAKHSSVITALTGGNFSHALLWLDGTDFIEAVTDGSRVISFARIHVHDPSRWTCCGTSAPEN